MHRRHKKKSYMKTSTCSWNILARGAQSVSLINLTTSVTVHSNGLLSRMSFSSSSCLISYKKTPKTLIRKLPMWWTGAGIPSSDEEGLAWKVNFTRILLLIWSDNGHTHFLDLCALLCLTMGLWSPTPSGSLHGRRSVWLSAAPQGDRSPGPGGRDLSRRGICLVIPELWAGFLTSRLVLHCIWLIVFTLLHKDHQRNSIQARRLIQQQIKRHWVNLHTCAHGGPG